MASVASGYDLSVSTFSPDGRVFQVEYAQKAVENSGTTIGAVCSDGVVLAAYKQLPSKLVVPSSAMRVYVVDRHAVVAVAGFVADARQVVLRAREECTNYRRIYGIQIPGQVLADRLSAYIHAFTAVWYVRPFGCGILVGVADGHRQPFPMSTTMEAHEIQQIQSRKVDDSKMASMEDAEPEMKELSAMEDIRLSLYSIDTAGTAYRYLATSIGKHSSMAKSELEKLSLKTLTCRQAVFEMCKILQQLNTAESETSSTGNAVIDMVWMTKDTSYKAGQVPTEFVKTEAARAAEEISRAEMQ